MTDKSSKPERGKASAPVAMGGMATGAIPVVPRKKSSAGTPDSADDKQD
ncbi:hypothetical protein [Nesterenkonia sp. NBAIMH1]|nr:hypothetical protein [Nesterenkonia sp. NBAIMH1]